MSIAKAIGIIHVVISHIYPSLFSIIRMSYTFHIPLFYFVSGYFYNEDYEKEKVKYIWSKFKKNVGLFYFCYVIMIVFNFLFYFKYKISFGAINFYSFFVLPFTTGGVDFMIGPSWFILSLFLVQTFFIFLYPLVKKIIENDYLKLLFFLLLGIASIYLNNKGWCKNEWLLLISRTFVGVMFYYFGLFYRKKVENINIFNSKFLLITLFLNMIISARFFPDTLIDIRSGSYHGHIILPIFMASIGIYLTLFISKCLVFILEEKNVFSIIGKYTFYIMMFHLFVNFLISFILIKLNSIPSELWRDLLLKSRLFPFLIEKLWPIYIILGIMVPVFFGVLFEKFKKFLRMKIRFYPFL